MDKIMPTIEQSSLALRDAQKILDNLNVPFMLDGSTLLGFIRDNQFAEDDHDDIDLTTLAEFTWDKKDEIRAAFVQAGFEVYHEWGRDIDRELSGQFDFKRDNVRVRLMFKEMKGNSHIWWTVYGETVHGEARWPANREIPIELMNDYVQISINLPIINKSITVGCPMRVEEYLCYRYKDWRTKVNKEDYSIIKNK